MAVAHADKARQDRPDLFRLAWPVSMEQILNMSLIWVDSIITNHQLGTAAFAAVQLGGQIINIISLILLIVATGVSVVISHQVGAHEQKEAGETAAQSIGLGVLVSVGLGSILYVGAPLLLHLLGAVGPVHTQGVTFLRIQAVYMPAQALLAVLSAALRATGNTRGPMLVTLLVNLLNAVLNYMLVIGTSAFAFGHVHIPAIGGGFGLAGSATGTSLSRTLGMLLMLYLLLRRSDLTVSLRHMFRFRRAAIGRVARIGFPGALESMSYQASQFVLSMVIAPLGTSVIAARGIALQAEGFTYVPATGLRVAAGILVGQLMGARRRDEAVAVGRQALLYGVAGIAVLAGVLFLFARPVAAIFTSDPAVLDVAAATLRVAALYKVGQIVNIVGAGIFGGAGNPQWSTKLTTISTWSLTVPLAFFAVRFGYGLTGVFWAMFLDEMLRGVVNLWYFTTPRWRHHKV